MPQARLDLEGAQLRHVGVLPQTLGRDHIPAQQGRDLVEDGAGHRRVVGDVVDLLDHLRGDSGLSPDRCDLQGGARFDPTDSPRGATEDRVDELDGREARLTRRASGDGHAWAFRLGRRDVQRQSQPYSTAHHWSRRSPLDYAGLVASTAHEEVARKVLNELLQHLGSLSASDDQRALLTEEVIWLYRRNFLVPTTEVLDTQLTVNVAKRHLENLLTLDVEELRSIVISKMEPPPLDLLPTELTAHRRQHIDERLKKLGNAAVMINALEEQEQQLATELRELEVPWQMIGNAIGVTGQTAYRRFDPNGQAQVKQQTRRRAERQG